jgi:hypothetical protein
MGLIARAMVVSVMLLMACRTTEVRVVVPEGYVGPVAIYR